MGSKSKAGKTRTQAVLAATGRPSVLLDTRVVYGCEIWGDNLEQLAKLPGACVDLIYTHPN